MENLNANQEKDVPNVVEAGVSLEKSKIRPEVLKYVDGLGDWAKNYKKQATTKKHKEGFDLAA